MTKWIHMDRKRKILTISVPLLTPINAGNEINFDTPDVKFRAVSVSIADVEDEDKATRLAKKILRDYLEREASDGPPPCFYGGLLGPEPSTTNGENKGGEINGQKNKSEDL